MPKRIRIHNAASNESHPLLKKPQKFLFEKNEYVAVSAAIEWLGEKCESLKLEAEEAARRKKEADEEEERKKHEGTKVRGIPAHFYI